MITPAQLREIGLSGSEAKIYLTLLKLGEATVAEVSQHSGLHRTNIYDSLEKLKEKGMCSYLSKENKQFFRAAEPESILNYLKEKENSVAQIIPELKKMQAIVEEKVIVEVFKGAEGLKSVLRDVLAKKQEVIGYGLAGQMRKFIPEFAKFYFREQNKYKISHKFIYTEGISQPPSKYYEIRYLPKEFKSTTINLCYSDIILDLIWEPEMVAVRIKSKQLVDGFKTQFKLLWERAKKHK